MTAPCISVILPVYNEEGNIATCLQGLSEALRGLDHEILVCYDFDEDKTLPAIAAMQDKPAAIKLVRNTLGRGVAFAIHAGLQAAVGDVLVTTMADLSDPPDVIPLMAKKIRDEGADVVSGSRYMKGGSQTGGPPFKALLSRTAGLSLRWLAGLGTHDATTNFRAYSRRYIERIRVESVAGFELALELTVKAHLQGFKVDEVPSSWKDRSAGESRFQLWKWMPRYLRWYLQALADPLIVWATLLGATLGALLLAARNGPVAPYWPDEWMYVPVVTGREPLTLSWLFAFHNEHRIPLPKLVWVAVERLSGFDGRWGSALNALILAGAAVLLVLGLRRLRGRMIWTDAIVPLLLLHGGHWEDITWPFQVAFTLFVLALAWILWRMQTPREDADPALGLGIFVLPFLGAATFPFVCLLAPWTIWTSRRDPRPLRRRLTMGLAAGSLLFLPFYFGFQRPDYFPPSPGPATDIAVAIQLLAGSLGIPGARSWPLSGWLAGAVVGVTAVLGLLRSKSRSSAGQLLVLTGLIVLALIIGHSRSGTSRFAGFNERYVTLFCLVPVLAYTAIPATRFPVVTRLAQALMLAAVALFYGRNSDHAEDILMERRHATRKLLRDVNAGVPIPLLARRHPYWSPQMVQQLEAGFSILAQDRISIYRNAPAPAAFPPGSRIQLSDGRLALDLTQRVEILLSAGEHEVTIDAGFLSDSAEVLTSAAQLQREGLSPQELDPFTIRREPTIKVYRIALPTAARLELSVNGPAERPWAIVEVR